MLSLTANRWPGCLSVPLSGAYVIKGGSHCCEHFSNSLILRVSRWPIHCQAVPTTEWLINLVVLLDLRRKGWSKAFLRFLDLSPSKTKKHRVLQDTSQEKITKIMKIVKKMASQKQARMKCLQSAARGWVSLNRTYDDTTSTYDIDYWWSDLQRIIREVTYGLSLIVH